VTETIAATSLSSLSTSIKNTLRRPCIHIYLHVILAAWFLASFRLRLLEISMMAHVWCPTAHRQSDRLLKIISSTGNPSGGSHARGVEQPPAPVRTGGFK